MTGLDEDRARAREVWAEVNAAFTGEDGRERWADEGIGWGLFRIPEVELNVLGDVRGLAVAELGCGTAYLSAELARRGVLPVALDLSRDQLSTARGCQRATGPAFGLVEASADELPLRSGSCDLVVSEYGAAPWCDPAAWVAEAARVLRPGGRLVFLTNSVLAALCVPAEGGVAGDRLLRPQHAVRTVTWPGGGTEHHVGHGDWIALLRVGRGFAVEALRELHAGEADGDPAWYEIVTADWARAWPAEDLWVARRTAGDDVVAPADRTDRGGAMAKKKGKKKDKKSKKKGKKK